ncbi:tyrosine-type recombinase/integrase [Cellulomonas triticagri]|nr:tyrosine-type recombinase/integrase [Cellulomonas triticagri]
MHPAGPPAPGHPTAHGDTPRAGTDPATDPLADFLTRAKDARARHRTTAAETAGGRPQDWAHPDRGAHLALPIGHRPVDRALLRSKEGKSRTNFLLELRVVYAMLTGVDRQAVTLEHLQAFPWHQVDLDGAADFRRAVYRRYEVQGTRNDKVCALRRVLDECYKRGLISARRLDLLKETLYTLAVDQDSTRRRRLSSDEIAALLRACASNRDQRAAARDAAIIALFRTSGIRGCELVRTKIADFDPAQHSLLLRETKNGRPHVIFLHPQAEEYLQLWLAHRGPQPGALFSALNRHDLTPLNVSTVRDMVHRRRVEAEVAPFGVHDFRRTFASDLLGRFDPALVSKLLNHRKLDSTMLYDVRGDELKRTAVASLALPAVPLLGPEPTIVPPEDGTEAAVKACTP